jgi:glycosyltransferase involved in cell wall biosynthesis
MQRFSAVTRVYYFEEPVYDDTWSGLQVSRPAASSISVLTPHLRKGMEPEEVNKILNRFLQQFLTTNGIEEYVSWYYSPMALLFTYNLTPVLTIYDCMDELSHFKFAPSNLTHLESLLFQQADLVFTGGYSLYEAKRDKHPQVFAFPSSIDKQHFMEARTTKDEPEDQQGLPHPRLGFYGVLDERFDFDLVDGIAKLRPDWQIILVGPIVKIDPASVPRPDNIHYLGIKDYSRLPSYLSGWDIAIMPFAINDSTRYISPTKTPEFLAAGKPVISTAIADVVNDYGQYNLVSICDTAEEFVQEAEQILVTGHSRGWLALVDQHLADNSWDNTWSKMRAIMNDALEEKNMPINRI